MRRHMTLMILSLVLAAAAAGATSGYVVVLKNGHRIPAQKTLEIEGKNAIITLVSGTVTSLPLCQVDLVATQRYNQLGLGSALTLEGLYQNTPGPTPTPDRPLGSYATLSGAKPMLGSAETPTPTPTPGIMLRNQPYPEKRIDEAFRQIFDERHLYLFHTSVGTKPDYFFVQGVTDSEREVFQTLKLTAEAYSMIHDLDPKQSPAAVELEMVTSGGKPAGTFRLTIDDARSLATGAVSVEQFYVKNVLF